ncbi:MULTISPECIES: NAD-dependent epimerase/dehydratase family protein [Streptomyces]|uniref:NAD-dependent epimerase n=1 Tax=Streptomyces spororaveus TaxID=284039 RepID=A0ABQ3T9B2_9ACTN|nr:MULTISPECIES: NAD(P)-dependent oxidoreductase [Streptomyces]MCM9082589.1 NAD(P)-dependent oxidoreductase [Streptomyces spororaveus]MCX5302645.1 NAD(P)-dependent oxidoreductase [Streptomyces sp. NBC_00160]GHI76989.1 NAD-dependent epimerase [Streptomyces spororaveus]
MIAVTGASGFCGGHVARAAAAAGAEVVCLGRRPGPVGAHRFWDAAAEPPDLSGVELVVHCAAAVGDPAPGSRAAALMRAVNVDGTDRLLRAAGGRPVVWVSSASVYDPRRGRGMVGEEHPRAGQLNAYGRTKAEGEALALAAGAVVLRPRAVYGPGDTTLLPRLLARVRAGTLLLPGPDVTLSLTAVENLTRACLTAAAWAPGAYNIADAEPYGRDAAVGAVLRAHGVRARIRHLPLPVAGAAARIAEAVAAATGAEPALSRYAVDQLAHPVVLDLARARAQGWSPHRNLADHLASLPRQTEASE